MNRYIMAIIGCLVAGTAAIYSGKSGLVMKFRHVPAKNSLAALLDPEMTMAPASRIPDEAAKPEPKSDIVTVGPKSFTGSTTLVVRDVAAAVEILPGANNAMIVTVSGAKNAVDQIKVSAEQDKRLVVSARGADLAQTNVKIRVAVPPGMNVVVSDVQGNVKIGDIGGPFKGRLSGNYSMFVGKVRNARLFVRGNGSIRVAEADGEKILMDVQGNGLIYVLHGRVQLADIRVTDSGLATFHGSAEYGNLRRDGSGLIVAEGVKHVSHPKTKPGDFAVD